MNKWIHGCKFWITIGILRVPYTVRVSSMACLTFTQNGLGATGGKFASFSTRPPTSGLRTYFLAISIALWFTYWPTYLIPGLRN
jgi:hypothetical protein